MVMSFRELEIILVNGGHEWDHKWGEWAQSLEKQIFHSWHIVLAYSLERLPVPYRSWKTHTNYQKQLQSFNSIQKFCWEILKSNPRTCPIHLH